MASKKGTPEKSTPEKSTSERIKATAFDVVERTVGRVGNLPFQAYVRMMPNDEGFIKAYGKARQKAMERTEGSYLKPYTVTSTNPRMSGGASVQTQERRKVPPPKPKNP